MTGQPREADARDSLMVLAIAITVPVGVGVLGQAWKGLPQEVLGLLLHASFLAVPLAYARLTGLRPLAANGFRRIGVRQVALVLVASLGSMWILKGLTDAQEVVFRMLGIGVEDEARQLTELVDRARQKGSVVALGLLMFVPALCEETMFRGILFRGLARSYGPAVGLIVTAGLFSAAHGKVVQAAPMLFLGIYFGLVVWLTGSLWAGVIAHGVNNLAVFVVTSVAGGRVDLLRTPAWMVALSAVVFFMALALLALERRVEMRPRPPA